MIKINEKKNIFGDEIAFVEQYDFSKANLSEENRIKAITTVASICYQNPKAIGSESLYNRLLAESKGLPSSSFEFVPVLISADEFANWCYINTSFTDNNPLTKYGEWILDGQYLLTNFRAVIYLKENFKMDFTNITKNCLNKFRQDYGYKDGSYQKIWNGREDNVVAFEIANEWGADEELFEQLYRDLETYYKEEVLHKGEAPIFDKPDFFKCNELN